MKKTIFTGALLLVASAGYAQNEGVPAFGSPNAVENQVIYDFGESWAEWKQDLKDNYGLVLNVDYTAVLLTANETFDDKDGSGGIARIFGTYDLFNIEGGTLVWKFESRHGYGSVAPFDFSLGQIGYVGLQEPPFKDDNFLRTQNFFWRQSLNGGRTTITAGVLDPTDYLDLYALISPWLHFMNFAFSTGSATIGLPNDAAVGVAFGTLLTDNWYMVGGITDTNGDPSDPFRGFSNFFSDNEYFTSLEIGYTTAPERLILDNYHVTLWHKDRQEAAGVPSGYGINFSAAKFIDDRVMPFARGGYAKDSGSLLEASLSAGVGYKADAFDGLLGAGVNWGRPNEDTFAPGLDDQLAFEVFYRAAAGRHLALTIDVQYINNPAINPNENNIWMFNLRGRATF